MRHFLFAIFFLSSLTLGGAVAYFYVPGKKQVSVYNFGQGEVGEWYSRDQFSFGPVPGLAGADFFKVTKERFIEKKESFIEANLSQMNLTVYKDGLPVKEVPILTKGREGLWWQTPAGLYKIESKAKSHYSSFGHVYQPYSMAFQGNFFIHGIPQYKDGSKVTSQFSGGCIRLSDEDAEVVYNLVSIGYPVLVFEKGFTSDGFTYEEISPTLTAEGYLVADLKNSFLFAGKRATTTMPVMSLTKLVTALVASEYINLDKDITVKERDLASTTVKRLKVGENVSAYSLLFPLLLESSNEAGEALATSLGRSYFISLMNKKAKAIGMQDTRFFDPSGADLQNISTPEDMFLLARYIYLNRRFVFNISSERVQGSAYENTFSNLQNFNVYKGDSEFIGGKIGKSDDPKENYVGVFEMEFSRELRPIVIVLFGSEDVRGDADKMREYLKEKYRAK
jgi:D-alanyl-D-alanine carboxypeptidase